MRLRLFEIKKGFFNKMSEASNNFLYELIDEDIANGKVKADEIHTRFPPEPNGYLHIGHCKAMIIDFGTARKYGGKCNRQDQGGR